MFDLTPTHRNQTLSLQESIIHNSIDRVNQFTTSIITTIRIQTPIIDIDYNVHHQPHHPIKPIVQTLFRLAHS